MARNQSSISWMLLAKAYGLAGDLANATYASAEYSFRIGNFDIAKKHGVEVIIIKKDGRLLCRP